MNKHIIKFRNNGENSPVWCGREIPDNTETLTINKILLGDCKDSVCQNCIKVVTRRLSLKLT